MDNVAKYYTLKQEMQALKNMAFKADRWRFQCWDQNVIVEKVEDSYQLKINGALESVLYSPVEVLEEITQMILHGSVDKC